MKKIKCVNCYAEPMGSIEFMYNFLTTKEFSKIQDSWIDKKYEPIVIIYYNKIEIWLS